jgi:hypothetical protein
MTNCCNEPMRLAQVLARWGLCQWAPPALRLSGRAVVAHLHMLYKRSNQSTQPR